MFGEIVILDIRVILEDIMEVLIFSTIKIFLGCTPVETIIIHVILFVLFT